MAVRVLLLGGRGLSDLFPDIPEEFLIKCQIFNYLILEEYYNKKLWHQLTIELRTLVKLPSMQVNRQGL